MSNRLEESWVELFSNTANVKNDLPETFSNMLLGHKFPLPLLFGFLHESTHHWCFDSIFGNMLYTLRVKSAKDLHDNLDDMADLDVEDSWDLFSDHIKYKFILSLYRPILEGMALFAEYDTIPSESEALPTHLIFTTMVFSGLFVKEASIQEHEEKYQEALFNMRINYCFGVESKANLLTSTLDVNKSPYLAGYLFIKNYWLTLRQKSKRFLDPNVFLHYLRNYLFNDLGIFTAVFSGKKDGQAIGEIWDYFIQRLQTLEDAEINDEDVLAFESACTSPNYYEGAANLLTPKNLVMEGNAILEGLYKKYIWDADIIVITNFLKRRYFRLCRLPGYIDINPVRVQVMVAIPFEESETFRRGLTSGFTVLIDGVYYKNMMSMPNTGQVFETQQSTGEITSYVQFGHSRPGLFFVKDGQVIYHEAMGMGSWKKEEVNVILDTAGAEDFGAVETIDEIVSVLYRLHPELTIVEKAILEPYGRALDTLYTRGAIISSPDERHDEITEKMRRFGFWQISGAEEDVIRLWSLVSLTTAHRIMKKSVVAEIAELYGLNFELTLRKAMEAQQAYEYEILVDTGEHLFTTVV